VRALMSTAPVAPDSYATPTDTYDYDAFGNLIGSTGTTPNVYRYQGEALDEETGLYYLRARYYDPVAGRFLTVDSMADEGEPPYECAGADPVNGHDPTGEQDAIEYAIIVAAFLLPPAHVPTLDLVSCMGYVIFSGSSPTSIAAGAAKAATCTASRSQGKGGKGGKGAPQTPSPCDTPAKVADGPVFNPSLWNVSPYTTSNNCYTYAENIRFNIPGFTQPGSQSPGGTFTALSCENIEAAAERDGLKSACPSGDCPNGYHRVELFIGGSVHVPLGPSLGADYHWYRQDANGLWSSKHGQLPVGNLQTNDPAADASAWGYDLPCHDMCARNQ